MSVAPPDYKREIMIPIIMIRKCIHLNFAVHDDHPPDIRYVFVDARKEI